MKSFKKILVPTDFSESGIAAYTHAQEIAKSFGAVVDFVHVIPTLKYFNESLSKLGVPLDDGDLYPTIQKETKHRLNGIMNDYIAEEHRGKVITRIERKAWHAITETAKAEGHDLVLMASRGQHESELLRGGTTEKVIRHSEVPVYSVNKRLSPDGFKKIVMPTDGSSVSFSALPVALSMALIYDADLTLLHISELYGKGIEEMDTPDSGNSEDEQKYQAVIDKLEDYLIDQKLDHVQIVRGDVDFEDQLMLSEGESQRRIGLFTVIEKDVSAHNRIAEYAAENADMVVMATHGHSGFAHFLLGSTTEKVVHHLNLPVVTVKPSAELLKR